MLALVMAFVGICGVVVVVIFSVCFVLEIALGILICPRVFIMKNLEMLTLGIELWLTCCSIFSFAAQKARRVLWWFCYEKREGPCSLVSPANLARTAWATHISTSLPNSAKQQVT